MRSKNFRVYPDAADRSKLLGIVRRIFPRYDLCSEGPLARDMMAAKHILDHSLKQEHLRPMLEWHAEIDHQWSIKFGPYGRRLKQHLRPDLWVELEGTYAGAELETNWEALFRTIVLMRRVASEVGKRLGYTYPQELERRVVNYLRKVR